MEMRPLNNEEIGKRIRERRNRLKMSQEAFAEAIGVYPSLISRIENGRISNLTIDLLIQIAEIFNITVNELCYETAGTSSEAKEMALLSDQKEAARILERLSDMERSFLMKMLRGAVQVPENGIA